MKLGLSTWIIALVFCFAACKSAPESVHDANSPVLKVAVMSDGRITVNGAPATIQSVRESLKQLAKQQGVVWYYREEAAAEPPPEAMQVMEAIVENRVPVRLSTQPDFSHTVGPDGSKP